MLYTRPASMDRGVLLTAVDHIAVIGTGVDKSQVFTPPPTPLADGQITLQYQMIANGTVTTLTVDLEVSADNGSTWNVVSAGINMQANPAGNLTVTSGMLYRLKVKTFALGTATALSICLSA